MDTARERDYLRDRVEQYRTWYDARARACKRWHLRLRVLALSAAAALPGILGLDVRQAVPAATIVSVLLVLVLGLDSVLRLREQWENYRYTEQYLDREKYLYLTSAGHYRGLSAEGAFLQFVERVEWAIAAENSATLATLALAPHPPAPAPDGDS